MGRKPTQGKAHALRIAVIAPPGAGRRHVVDAIKPDATQVLEAADADGLGDSSDRLDAVIVALDRRNEDANVIGAVRERLPDVSLIAVAPAADRRRVRNVLTAGADGLVLEDRLGESLANAVRSALAGQLSLPREYRDQDGPLLLSPREKQVLGMVVLGFTNGEIARRLYVAETTIKSHLSSAFTKLGVRSRKEATALILDPEGGLGTGILAISDDDGTSAAARW